MIDGYTMYVRRLNSRYKDTYLKQMKKKIIEILKSKQLNTTFSFSFINKYNQIYPSTVKSEQSKEKIKLNKK